MENEGRRHKFEAQDAFWKSIIEKYEARNQELEGEQIELQGRIDQMDASMPAVMAFNMAKLAQGQPDADVGALVKVPCTCLQDAPTERLKIPDLSAVSVFSIEDADVHYMDRIKDLTDQEKKLIDEVNKLRSKEKAIKDTKKKVEKLMGEERKNKVSVDGNELQRMNERLLDENRMLNYEIADLKLEMKHIRETIEGPLARELDRERRKALKLEAELKDKMCQENARMGTAQREVDFLREQLKAADKNLRDMVEINNKLKAEMDIIEHRMNELQTDLINQKISEATCLAILKSQLAKPGDRGGSGGGGGPSPPPPPSGGGGGGGPSPPPPPSKEDGGGGGGGSCHCMQKPPCSKHGSLYEIARDLSNELKEAEQNKNIPDDLKDTVDQIKSLCDLIDQNICEGKEEKDDKVDKGDKVECGSGEEVILSIQELELPEEKSAVTQLEEVVEQAQEEEEEVASAEVTRVETAEEAEEPEEITPEDEEPVAEVAEEITPEDEEPVAEVAEEITPEDEEPVAEVAEEITPEDEELVAEVAEEITPEDEEPAAEEELPPAEEELDQIPERESKELPPEEIPERDDATKVDSEYVEQIEAVAELETGEGDDIQVRKISDGLNITTTVTRSGILEVVTEGPEGLIETTLTVTESGNVEVVTEFIEGGDSGTGLGKSKTGSDGGSGKKGEVEEPCKNCQFFREDHAGVSEDFSGTTFSKCSTEEVTKCSSGETGAVYAEEEVVEEIIIEEEVEEQISKGSSKCSAFMEQESSFVAEEAEEVSIPAEEAEKVSIPAESDVVAIGGGEGAEALAPDEAAVIEEAAEAEPSMIAAEEAAGGQGDISSTRDLEETEVREEREEEVRSAIDYGEEEISRIKPEETSEAGSTERSRVDEAEESEGGGDEVSILKQYQETRAIPPSEFEKEAESKEPSISEAPESSVSKIEEAAVKSKESSVSKIEKEEKSKESSISKIEEAEIKSKESSVSKIEKEEKSKESSISKVEAEIKSKESSVSEIEKEAKSKESSVSKIEEAEIKSKESSVSEIEKESKVEEAEIKSKESSVSEIEKEAKSKESSVSKVEEAEIKSKESSVSKIEEEEKSKESSISKIEEAAVESKESSISEMEKSVSKIEEMEEIPSTKMEAVLEEEAEVTEKEYEPEEEGEIEVPTEKEEAAVEEKETDEGKSDKVEVDECISEREEGATEECGSKESPEPAESESAKITASVSAVSGEASEEVESVKEITVEVEVSMDEALVDKVTLEEESVKEEEIAEVEEPTAVAEAEDEWVDEEVEVVGFDSTEAVAAEEKVEEPRSRVLSVIQEEDIDEETTVTSECGVQLVDVAVLTDIRCDCIEVQTDKEKLARKSRASQGSRVDIASLKQQVSESIEKSNLQVLEAIEEAQESLRASLVMSQKRLSATLRALSQQGTIGSIEEVEEVEEIEEVEEEEASKLEVAMEMEEVEEEEASKLEVAMEMEEVAEGVEEGPAFVSVSVKAASPVPHEEEEFVDVEDTVPAKESVRGSEGYVSIGSQSDKGSEAVSVEVSTDEVPKKMASTRESEVSGEEIGTVGEGEGISKGESGEKVKAKESVSTRESEGVSREESGEKVKAKESVSTRESEGISREESGEKVKAKESVSTRESEGISREESGEKVKAKESVSTRESEGVSREESGEKVEVAAEEESDEEEEWHDADDSAVVSGKGDFEKKSVSSTSLPTQRTQVSGGVDEASKSSSNLVESRQKSTSRSDIGKSISTTGASKRSSRSAICARKVSSKEIIELPPCDCGPHPNDCMCIDCISKPTKDEVSVDMSDISKTCDCVGPCDCTCDLENKVCGCKGMCVCKTCTAKGHEPPTTCTCKENCNCDECRFVRKKVEVVLPDCDCKVCMCRDCKPIAPDEDLVCGCKVCDCEDCKFLREQLGDDFVCDCETCDCEECLFLAAKEKMKEEAKSKPAFDGVDCKCEFAKGGGVSRTRETQATPQYVCKNVQPSIQDIVDTEKELEVHDIEISPLSEGGDVGSEKPEEEKSASVKESIQEVEDTMSVQQGDASQVEDVMSVREAEKGGSKSAREESLRSVKEGSKLSQKVEGSKSAREESLRSVKDASELSQKVESSKSGREGSLRSTKDASELSQKVEGSKSGRDESLRSMKEASKTSREVKDSSQVIEETKSPSKASVLETPVKRKSAKSARVCTCPKGVPCRNDCQTSNIKIGEIEKPQPPPPVKRAVSKGVCTCADEGVVCNDLCEGKDKPRKSKEVPATKKRSDTGSEIEKPQPPLPVKRAVSKGVCTCADEGVVCNDLCQGKDKPRKSKEVPATKKRSDTGSDYGRNVAELHELMEQIKCACQEAEAVAKPPLVKQASDMTETLSSLEVALEALQQKSETKDVLIDALKEELRLRAKGAVFEKMIDDMFTAREDVDDYDRATLAETLPKPVDKDLMKFGRLPLSCICNAKKSASEVCECKVSPSPLEINDIRRIGPTSVLIKWIPARSDKVMGYEICVGDIVKSRVFSPRRTSAIVDGLNMKDNVNISIYATCYTGRCNPPATAVYKM